MRIKILAALIVVFYLPSSVVAQGGTIKGYVYDDMNKAVADVKVVFDGANVTTTDSEGHFSISFNISKKPGATTTVNIERSGFVVFSPMFGNETIRIKENQAQLDIIIVPKGSPRSFESLRLDEIITKMRIWTNARLEQLKPRSTFRNNQANRVVEDADFDEANEEFLQSYASEYSKAGDHTFLARLKKSLDEWSHITQARNKLEESNQKYWRHIYDDSTSDTLAFARDKTEQSKNDRDGLEIKRRRIDAYMAAAYTSSLRSSYKHALEIVMELQHKFDSGEFPKDTLQEEWADTLLFLSGMKSLLGAGTPGDEGLRLLKESVEPNRQAIATYYTIDRSPQDWVLAQKQLSRLLRSLGARTDGEAGLKLMGEAIQVYRSALTVLNTLDKSWVVKELSPRRACYCDATEYPQALAIAKSEFASSLLYLGQATGGDEGLKLLRESVDVYRAALNVKGFTPDKFPKDWANAQSYLGCALTELGEVTVGDEGLKLLQESVDIHRIPLSVKDFTFEKFPHDWVGMQFCSGHALRALGERTGGANELKLLKEEVEIYRTILNMKGFTVKDFPSERLSAQHRLGGSLETLGERTGGDEGLKLLREAVDIYRAALSVKDFTFEKFPQEWTLTQSQLGNSLQSFDGKVKEDEALKLLREVVDIYRLVLKEMDKSPELWGVTAVNPSLFSVEEFPVARQRIHAYLGYAIYKVGAHLGGDGGLKLLRESVDVYRVALKVKDFTPDKFPKDWAYTKTQLGATLTALSEATGGAEGLKILQEAVEVYRAASNVKGFTPDKFPKDWLNTQFYLGGTLTTLGQATGGPEGLKLLWEAADVYRAILNVKGFSFEQSPSEWTSTRRSLGGTLVTLGQATGGDEGLKLLREAMDIYHAALNVKGLTAEKSPREWSIIQNGLAYVHYLLGEFAVTEKIFEDLLRVDPLDAEANPGAFDFYRHQLFQFEKAFSLSQQWLARYPEDLPRQILFTENHFTTGRFDVCRSRITGDLGRPETEVPIRIKTPLRAIEIANLFALGNENLVADKLELLIAEVNSQPPTFRVDWTFTGSRHFINQNQKLTPHRVWLNNLFEALLMHDKDAMLTALSEVKANFKK